MYFNWNSSSLSLLGIILETSCAIPFMNQIMINVLIRLKKVWKSERAYEVETGSPELTPGINLEMKPIKGWKINSIQITPNRLKTVCAKAALLAETLAGRAAMLAVMVVPMFSPKTIAAASSKGIHPLAHMIRVIAIVALDD